MEDTIKRANQMKPLLIILLIPSILTAQINLKRVKVKYPLLFVTGMVQGAHEASMHHYDIFKRVNRIPDRLDYFYNPSISWKNKYKQNYTQEKFLGSSTIFVGLTDFYHLSKQIFISGMVIGFTININQKQTFKSLILESLVGCAVQKAGFLIVYNGIYR